MKLLQILLAGSMLLISCSVKKGKTEEATDGETSAVIVQTPYIERLEMGLDKVIAPGTKVEIIAEGFDWTEGPLWINDLGLLFSDIPPNKIYKWTETSGVELFLFPSGYTDRKPRAGEPGANGLLLDAAGNLILCQHGDRRIAQMSSSVMDPKAEFLTIIDNYKGKRLNSPNDACFSSEGILFFTDPAYGLEGGIEDPKKELDFQGVFSFSESVGLRLMTDQLSRPNGIALSPDEEFIYVANSDPDRAIWMKYKLNPDNTIGQGEVFCDATHLTKTEPGLPDGLKVDQKGNVFASGPGGVWIFDESGILLGKIMTGQATSNCAFGNDGKVLYITADMYVMKVALL